MGASLSSIWPSGAVRNEHGELTLRGRTATSLLDEFGSPLYVVDMAQVRERARLFRQYATQAFATTTTHVSFAGKALLTKAVVRAVVDEGLLVDTCSMGEMRIALAAGAPGRRLVLHGNNKSDEEIELAIARGFAKIVVDSPDEPERIARIARRLGKRAKVMVRVTSGVHAGGHEYISTAHEDQKFGLPLLPAQVTASQLAMIDEALGAGSADGLVNDAALAQAMSVVANGQAHDVLRVIASYRDDVELVGIHSHIGSQIHDAEAFIEAAKRMMLLRRTVYATQGITLPEVDLGGGYSVAYTDGEDAMDVAAQLRRLADAVGEVNRVLGMPMPVISFEPGRWIVAPAGVTLYRVGTVKPVDMPIGTTLDDGTPIDRRVYVSVDGGMSDNIRPALYGARYAALLANRCGDDSLVPVRVVGMHCESGDIVVHECWLPADIRRGDVLAIPVTGAYGRTMASNYNQVLIPAVVGVDDDSAWVMLRRQTIEDLLSYDLG